MNLAHKPDSKEKDERLNDFNVPADAAFGSMSDEAYSRLPDIVGGDITFAALRTGVGVGFECGSTAAALINGAGVADKFSNASQ